MVKQIATLKSKKPIGGWVVKANPAVYDVRTEIEEFGAVTGWTLHPTYRLGLVLPAHPVFLWVSGDDPLLPSGLWGVGEVRRRPYPTTIPENAEGWDPDHIPRGTVASVDTWIQILATPVPRGAFQQDPVLGTSELILAKQMSNPVALTPQEVDRVMAFDMATIPMTTEQRDAIDALFDDRVWIDIDTTDGRIVVEEIGLLWAVTEFDRDRRPKELLRTSALADALDFLAQLKLPYIAKMSVFANSDWVMLEACEQGLCVVRPAALARSTYSDHGSAARLIL
jgi:hypothetical protein